MNFDQNVPHIIKYMGSKRQILDFIVEGISDCYTGGTICDLFAGSSVLSGALRNEATILSNDIQKFSSVLANMYLSDYDWGLFPNLLEEIVLEATNYVEQFKELYPMFSFDYDIPLSLKEFNHLEMQQQNLINQDFSKVKYHLFVKNYSGTYWSFNQCLWIDAFRFVADKYLYTPIFYIILSSLMFAMSYNSQSTGHYAQYRDATSQSSMDDIAIYRKKSILPFFIKKFKELQSFLGKNKLGHSIVSMDFSDCLDIIKPNSIIYADPPYCFVHYSRFYHALETLIRYDYPKIMFKGRYRSDRHQSPFCIKTKVENAFKLMFSKINDKNSNLVLSYSNTGMISLETLLDIANKYLNDNYNIEVLYQEHQHSTMGRKNDKSRNVQESLLMAKRK
ncbi:DNA adenine methylase [Herbivorax sp. ANBcel31]|uniref:DNA adenine methylase n=1 Tax=Herbivorax sp. ANBcel31 TaxID=3069754 RepID=UPI0027B3CE3F|nr:DNA adenine methylase [Herbivorax sp. ANBcel31]MDQ2088237.1 DNA adenine methylase [Herbivorax sp. ANBcel31]